MLQQNFIYDLFCFRRISWVHILKARREILFITIIHVSLSFILGEVIVRVQRQHQLASRVRSLFTDKCCRRSSPPVVPLTRGQRTTPAVAGSKLSINQINLTSRST